MSDRLRLSVFTELGKEMSARCTNVCTRSLQEVEVGFAVESSGMEQGCWSWRFSFDCVNGPKRSASSGLQGVDGNFVIFVSVAAANGFEMANLPAWAAIGFDGGTVRRPP